MEEVKNKKDKSVLAQLIAYIISILLGFLVTVFFFYATEFIANGKVNEAKIESYKLAKEAHQIANSINKLKNDPTTQIDDSGEGWINNKHVYNWKESDNKKAIWVSSVKSMSNEKCYLVNLFLSKRPVEEIKAEDLNVDQCELNK